jgi:phosphorylase/glycogen(starch) synthase
MASAPLLIEVSWEVANQVGGIWTVITSKLPRTQELFSGAYLAIGPDLGQSADVFQPLPLPQEFRHIAEDLAKMDIFFRVGRWNVPGEPLVVLIDWSNRAEESSRNALKAQLWQEFHLDTLGSDLYDLDTPLIWSWCAGEFIRSCNHHLHQPITVHAHEWLAAGTVLSLARAPHSRTIKSVFTTHATVLGRSRASRNLIPHDPRCADAFAEARSYGVATKHHLEQLGLTKAQAATAVSGQTAHEVHTYHGILPVVTENALDTSLLATFSETRSARSVIRGELFRIAQASAGKKRILEPEPFHIAIFGRPEMESKGYDFICNTLNTFNRMLQRTDSRRTVIAWFLIPTEHRSATHPALVRSLAAYDATTRFMKNGQLTAVHWSDPSDTITLDASTTHQWEKTIHALQQDVVSNTALLTQPAYAQDLDPLLTCFATEGLTNKEEDCVHVLRSTSYLDGSEPLFGRPLQELLSGFDLALLPSKYEPWGYTPHESLAAGVPTILSTASGFGEALTAKLTLAPQQTTRGWWTLPRGSVTEDAAAKTQLLFLLDQLLHESAHTYDRRCIDAFLTAQEFSWSTALTAYARVYAAVWNKHHEGHA